MKLGADAFDLPPTMNHDTCGLLAEALIGGRGQVFTLDASRVHHLGARAAQMIVVAKRSWLADGYDFRINAPSRGFISSLQTLGLDATVLEGETAHDG